jgi:hypothetical protein
VGSKGRRSKAHSKETKEKERRKEKRNLPTAENLNERENGKKRPNLRISGAEAGVAHCQLSIEESDFDLWHSIAPFLFILGTYPFCISPPISRLMQPHALGKDTRVWRRAQRHREGKAHRLPGQPWGTPPYPSSSRASRFTLAGSRLVSTHRSM